MDNMEQISVSPERSPKEKPLFSGLRGKKNASAIQTYFRNLYRSHNSLSPLADRKANIMIRMNSLLISLLLIAYGAIESINFTAMIAGAILLLTTLVALIFAALAARPEVTQLPVKADHEEAVRSMGFFGNFVQLERAEYEKTMDEVLQENALVYHNMVRDLYYLGKVMDKKFRQLRLSYNVFILGFLVAVLTFFISTFLQ